VTITAAHETVIEETWVRIFSTGSRANDFAKLIAADLPGSIARA
jgi:hypothetical protein